MKLRNFIGAIIVASGLASPLVQGAEPSPRERILLNSDWRFRHDDPADVGAPLRYDVRPEVADAQDSKVADARPEAAERVTQSDRAGLKPWILPTGNAFIKDSARRYVRPAGDPGSDVSYVQSNFHD